MNRELERLAPILSRLESQLQRQQVQHHPQRRSHGAAGGGGGGDSISTDFLARLEDLEYQIKNHQNQTLPGI